MSNLLASQKVMTHYLSALLTEDAPVATAEVDEDKKQQLNRLLSQAVVVAEQPVTPVTEHKTVAEVSSAVTADLTSRNIPVAERITAQLPSAIETVKPYAGVVTKEYRQGRFQALFFDVAGLKIAVPLKELGGIHQMETTKSLFGKPSWFKGVMLYREQKINVVDTACWVMPEKYDKSLEQKLNYQYVIMLGSSNWGLGCESLINTVTLEQDDVKWRETEGKRPWMAGLIKKHMCVLVDVEAMIDLLSRGLDINQ